MTLVTVHELLVRPVVLDIFRRSNISLYDINTRQADLEDD